MAESKNYSIPPTIDHGIPVAERRDRAHGHPGNQPHAAFGHKNKTSGNDSSGDHLPPKLQARMAQLMADLAALEEPDFYEPQPGDLLEVTPEPTAREIHPEWISSELRQQSPLTEPAANANSIAIEPRPTVPFQRREESFDEQPPQVATLEPLPESIGVDFADSPSLADVSTSFSRQAREILEILKRRQDELSLQKNELELREAGLEKRIRQERLALVERQRQLEQSLTLPAPVAVAANAVAANTATSAEASSQIERSADLRIQNVAVPANSIPATEASTSTLPDDSHSSRKITPEWIAANERLVGGSMANQDGDFYAVIEEFVARQVQLENGTSSIVAPVGAVVSPSETNSAATAVQPRTRLAAHQPLESPANGALQHQAQHLRQQHETAIRSLRQTRRQLELLKDILAQQQSQWAKQIEELERSRIESQETYSTQQQNWLTGLEDLERLRTIEQNESAKRKTFLDQREASLHGMEERLQQAQVEILRDRVVLKQLERTVRQSMSNADWNQRWQVISEETQSYLKKVHEEAAAVQSDTKRKLERLESRKSELLLYRESLRNWIERQMKLISRRVAHSEDREMVLQQLSESLLDQRRDLKAQQDALNELFGQSLEVIEGRLNSASLPSQEAA
ncbi:MAG: hypothetical protein JNK57_11885 [Planctomycetaceae bacterium]|nr:hypothetical protein [Planctomycetaceae bacterium]